MAGSRPRFQVVSRSSGRAVCAMAAYRAAEKIEDQTYAKTHDYERKAGVLHSEVIAPEYAPDWATDRQALWNAVEQAELKRNGDLKQTAQLAREIIVPLAHELDLETNKATLREWVDENFVSAGMVADVSIHQPHHEGDQRNIHAHVLLTMREITPEGFHEKKTTPTKKAWDRTDFLEHAIDQWEHVQNRELEAAGLDVRVNFKSFEERGIDREPEQHEGVAATAMKRKGQQTRIAEDNDSRRDRNDDRVSNHLKALHEMVRVEEERARFEDWRQRKVAELESAQTLSLIDLERVQELDAIEHEDRMQAFYAPSLATVEAEAKHLASVIEGRGLRFTVRRLWQGRQDRERLEALQATIEDTRSRMKEARDRIAAIHAEEKARVAELQEQRRREQQAGLDKAEAEKDSALTDRLRKAEKEAEATASPKADLQAELDGIRAARQKWREERKADLLREARESRPERGRDKGMDFER